MQTTTDRTADSAGITTRFYQDGRIARMESWKGVGRFEDVVYADGTMKETEYDHQEHDARFVLWQEIQDGKAHILPGGQLEEELELEFGAFAHPDDDEPSLVPGVTLGELRRRSDERTADDFLSAPPCTTRNCASVFRDPARWCAACRSDQQEPNRTAFSVLSAFFSLPLGRKERPLPLLVTRARAADLFERFFGRRTYLGGRIYS